MKVLVGCRVRFRDCMLTVHYLNITCTRCIWIIVITTCISEIDRSNCAFRVQTEGRHATWNRLRRRPCQKCNVRHLDCPLCSDVWIPGSLGIITSFLSQHVCFEYTTDAHSGIEMCLLGSLAKLRMTSRRAINATIVVDISLTTQGLFITIKGC